MLFNQADRIDADAVLLAEHRVDVNRDRTGLQGIDERSGICGCVMQFDVEGRDVGGVCKAVAGDFNVVDAGKAVGDDIHQVFPTGVTRGVTFLNEEAQGGENADDLFLAGFAGTPDAVLGNALHAAFVDEGCGRLPHIPENIEIEMLEGGGHNKIALATENAAGLRPANDFTAREGDEIGTFIDKALQI